jgi:hypothetical protein
VTLKIIIKENGKKGCMMVMDNFIGKMDNHIEDSIAKVLKMEEVNINLLLEINMMGYGLMGNKMGMELFMIKMGLLLNKDNGNQAIILVLIGSIKQ